MSKNLFSGIDATVEYVRYIGEIKKRMEENFKMFAETDAICNKALDAGDYELANKCLKLMGEINEHLDSLHAEFIKRSEEYDLLVSIGA